MQDVIETAKIVSVLGSDIVKLHSLYIYCISRSNDCRREAF